MEIDTAALIRYDLCHESESDLLLSSLQRLYNNEGEQFGEQVLGGQQWERYRFEGDLQLPDDSLGVFNSVKTFVSFETRHLIDAVTVAELSEEQVKEIEEEEANRTQYVIDDLAEQFSRVAEKFPRLHRPISIGNPSNSTLSRQKHSKYSVILETCQTSC
ncbi:hypothetical protein [Halobacterium salinarum]|uniref:hypothetical protein n=1 Tax=Halobacterium salinarum TaxID=2242 RepID=UPI002553E164|nr:hypothetical protein [Halobacterium salinarum]MDL0133875.1 hypothetical protein [Halobacterium salinarum]